MCPELSPLKPLSNPPQGLLCPPSFVPVFVVVPRYATLSASLFAFLIGPSVSWEQKLEDNVFQGSPGYLVSLKPVWAIQKTMSLKEEGRGWIRREVKRENQAHCGYLFSSPLLRIQYSKRWERNSWSMVNTEITQPGLFYSSLRGNELEGFSDLLWRAS